MTLVSTAALREGHVHLPMIAQTAERTIGSAFAEYRKNRFRRVKSLAP